jgi:hypothetical protein
MMRWDFYIGIYIYTLELKKYYLKHRIGGVMVSVIASSAIDRGLELRSGQIKDYKISICCFSAKHAALRRKSKDWLARNQNNVS